MNYIIGRPINGISLNGYEYLHNEDLQLLTFDTKDDALDFLSREFPTNSRIELDEMFLIEKQQQLA